MNRIDTGIKNNKFDGDYFAFLTLGATYSIKPIATFETLWVFYGMILDLRNFVSDLTML